MVKSGREGSFNLDETGLLMPPTSLPNTPKCPEAHGIRRVVPKELGGGFGMGDGGGRDRPAHTPGVISLRVPRRCVWAEPGGRGGADQQKTGEGKMAA